MWQRVVFPLMHELDVADCDYCTDLDLMLVTTHDPIGDFINAVSADMVCFASNRTYLELAHETEILNQLDSYPQLVRRADRIGYKINKVSSAPWVLWTL